MKILFDVQNRSERAVQFQAHVFVVKGEIGGEVIAIPPKLVATIQTPIAYPPGHRHQFSVEWAYTFSPWECKWKSAIESSGCWAVYSIVTDSGRPLVANAGAGDQPLFM